MWVVVALCLSSFFLPGDAPTADRAEYREVAWRHLQTVTGFGPRNPGSRGHRDLKKFILAMGGKYADRVAAQEFMHRPPGRDPVPMVNIEMKFMGKDQGKRPILIGAHYDTRPFADRDPDPALRSTPILGANDGGSGTAVLLGLAQYLHENKPQTPVHLVFFDGEDYGTEGSADYLLGSTFYAGQLDEDAGNEWPFGVLVIDMVGDKDLQIYKENHSVQSAPWLVDIIYRVARQKHKLPQFKEEIKYKILDDHYPFIQRGIPSVLLIDFDYPHWHKQSDTLEKCSAESLFAVFTVVVDTLVELKVLD